jgi:hypothetical protein
LTINNPNHYWGIDTLTYQAYDGTEYSDVATINMGLKRTVDYNVSSHDYENYIMPWFDLASIVEDLGFAKNDSYNTNAAYADFNGDNYFDIMIQPNVNDGVPVDTYFLINNGDNSFYIDNDFPISINDSFISSRKTIVGDFNGDGKPDVVRPQGGHDYLAKPSITLSNESGYELKLIDDAPDIQPHTVSSGDIDSDGDLDLFFAQAGEYDGFAINDGSGNFSWRWIDEIITDFDKGHTYPTGGYGYYGFWSSEMTDVDSDGLIDLILGGSYKDQDYDAMFDGPTVLWGDVSGTFSISNSTTLYDAANLNYLDGNKISISHDYAVNDVDGNGYKDIALESDLPNNNGVVYQIMMSYGDRSFEDKTDEFMNSYMFFNSYNHVWTIMRDIDNNGQIDIVEGEPRLSVPWPLNWRNSVRWEWNGSSFTKIQ